MTICNMSIEGGARAGLIAPDDTTFEYVAGRPHAPAGRGLGRGGRALADAPDRRRRGLRQVDHDRRRRPRADGHLRHEPGHGHAHHRPRPEPRRARPTRASAARSSRRSSTWTSSPASRSSARRSTSSSSAPARTAASATCGWRPRVLEGRHIADGVRADGRARARDEVKREAEREGLAEIFRAAGADWREAGCSMCIAMNGDQLTPGPVHGQHQQPQLRGPPGQGRPHVPGLAADRRRERDRRRRQPTRAALPGIETAGRGRRAAERWPSPSRSSRSKVVPLPAENVDTDQIIPARYLKVDRQVGPRRGASSTTGGSTRTARSRTRAFVLDQPEMAGPPDPARRRQLRGRLVARARAVGADLVGHPGHPLDALRGHLPQQRLKNGVLPIVVDADTHARLFELLAARPGRRADRRPRRAGRAPARTARRSTSTSTRSPSGCSSPAPTSSATCSRRTPSITAWEAAHPPRIDTLAGAR